MEKSKYNRVVANHLLEIWPYPRAFAAACCLSFAFTTFAYCSPTPVRVGSTQFARDRVAIEDALTRAECDLGPSLDKNELIEKLVLTCKGEPGDPTIPEGFVDRVKLGMRVYPRSFLCFLLKNKCFVYVAPFVTSADPSLKDARPEGYSTGSTYLNCRAVYTTKGVLIGSHFYRSGKLLPNLNPVAGVQHEMAHAIDQLLGRPSLSRFFADAYNYDNARIVVSDKAPLAYYLQSGNVGQIETFGQLLAHRYSHFTEHHTLALVRCFPQCVRFIDRRFPPADTAALDKPTRTPN